MKPTRAQVLRTVLCTSASAMLLTSFGAAGAHADGPTPKPTVKGPGGSTSLPGADEPTTIPTTAPSLPGEGGAPAPDYSEPPDNFGNSKPTPRIDSRAAGLRLADGA